MSTRRQVNRLLPEAIDEVSSVDSPANQLGLIAIAKRAGESQMAEYYDAEGNEVDLDTLEFGGQVYDADGTPFVLRSDDEIQDMIDAGELTEDQVVDIDDEADDQDQDADDRELVGAGAMGKRAGLGRTQARGRGTPGVSGGPHSRTGAGRSGRSLGEGGRKRFGKSTGQAVLEELRKAMTDADRDEILSRVLDRFDAIEDRAARAEGLIEKMAARAEDERFVAIAKSFDGVPVDTDELAGILAAATSVMSKRQLETFERILTAAADSELFDERGYSGNGGSSSVMENVSALAYEVVGKSGGMTIEQAATALFDANPDAYLEYEAERYG